MSLSTASYVIAAQKFYLRHLFNRIPTDHIVLLPIMECLSGLSYDYLIAGRSLCDIPHRLVGNK